jgi:uncharacterized protein YvpB
MEIIDTWVGKFFERTSFEAASIISLILLIVWLCYLVLALLPKILGEKSKASKQLVAGETKLLKKIAKALWFIPKMVLKTCWYIVRPSFSKSIALSIILIVYASAYTYHYFFSRPWVVFQAPSAAEPWFDQKQPIKFVFNKPVDINRLQLNFSNDLKGKTVWTPSFPNSILADKLYREVSFYPDKTIFPEENFVVYLVGISTLGGAGGIHEHNSDFSAPKLPGIASFAITDGAKSIAPDGSFDLNFTQPNGDFVDWEFELSPEAEIAVEKKSPTLWSLSFPEGLDQDKSYLFNARRTVVERATDDGELLSTLEPQTVSIIKFTTVSAALVKNVSLSGNNVITDKPLVLTFDEPMETESVMANLTIAPEITGTFAWNEAGSKLTFTPEGLWAKATKYNITIKKEARAKAGGRLTKDIVHTFDTVGKTKVKSFNPKLNTVNVTVNKYIVIEFNQPVDRKSANSMFSISPNVNGRISWANKDRRLTFVPSGNLGYSTRYTVKIKAGVKSVYGLDSDEAFSTAFTTQPQEFILAVPQYYQQERYSCNLSATRMALGYRGVYLSESSIKQGMGIGASLNGSYGGDPYNDWIDGYGTYWTNASSYISGYRKTAIKTGWNTTDMLQSVSNGNPVILWWQNGWSDWYRKSWTTSGGKSIEGLNGMHSEVVVGFRGPIGNPDYVITNDPWRGRRFYTRSYFDNLWASSFSRTAVVVY